MNKTSKLFLGFASLAMLSACSSDEPKGEVTTPAWGNGTIMYLSVDIADANSMGRALEDLTEGDYTIGQGKESNVKSANFFFFDANGIYLTQASVWDDKVGGPVADTDKDNVEYIGKNVLVLENLTEQNLPMYVVTVLNPAKVLDEGGNEVDLATKMVAGSTTMDDLRKSVMKNYYDKAGNFTMTTTSFANSANAAYYATFIPAGSLVTNSQALASANPLKIYVERVAAKYTLSLDSNDFDIQLTLAGAGNNEGDNNDQIGDTHLKVKVTGFGITTTEKTSYFSKNLDGFVNADFTAANVADGWNWNSPENHRSFWGKSVSYNQSDANLYNHSTVYAANKNGLAGATYSFENTNNVASITRAGSNPAEVDASMVTNFVFTAKVYDGNDPGAELNLVRFRGLYYKDDSFKRYMMENLDGAEKLNLWTLESQSSDLEVDKDGVITSTTTSDFKQVDTEILKYVKKEDATGGRMKVVFDPDYNKALYTRDGNKYTPVASLATVKTEINNWIEAFFGTNYPVRYNGGNTYYTVPVQHLLGTDNKVTINKEGEFGVVRNHWYEIKLNKISKIGQGVFNPGTGEGEDSDIIYPDPDPDPDTYGLAAKINILSWKVVKQSVDL